VLKDGIAKKAAFSTFVSCSLWDHRDIPFFHESQKCVRDSTLIGPASLTHSYSVLRSFCRRPNGRPSKCRHPNCRHKDYLLTL
jgi:hypothetical protein